MISLDEALVLADCGDPVNTAPRSMPSCETIAGWWCDNGVILHESPPHPDVHWHDDPARKLEWDIWYAEAQSSNFYPCIDYGEPSCMACGGMWADTWTGYYYERAHLRARCHGGSDHPCNLLVVCARCHSLIGTREDWLSAALYVAKPLIVGPLQGVTAPVASLQIAAIALYSTGEIEVSV